MPVKPGTLLSVRLEPDLEKRVEMLVRLEGRSRADEIRAILRTGTDARLRDLAVDLYRTDALSLGKAAELADLPLEDFILLLKKSGLGVRVDEALLLEGLRE